MKFARLTVFVCSKGFQRFLGETKWALTPTWWHGGASFGTWEATRALGRFKHANKSFTFILRLLIEQERIPNVCTPLLRASGRLYSTRVEIVLVSVIVACDCRYFTVRDRYPAEVSLTLLQLLVAEPPPQFIISCRQNTVFRR
jgi:hypothetical protein